MNEFELSSIEIIEYNLERINKPKENHIDPIGNRIIP
jgi:hypothetical protein